MSRNLRPRKRLAGNKFLVGLNSKAGVDPRPFCVFRGLTKKNLDKLAAAFMIKLLQGMALDGLGLPNPSTGNASQ
jgi:hypothetical protein